MAFISPLPQFNTSVGRNAPFLRTPPIRHISEKKSYGRALVLPQNPPFTVSGWSKPHPYEIDQLSAANFRPSRKDSFCRSEPAPYSMKTKPSDPNANLPYGLRLLLQNFQQSLIGHIHLQRRDGNETAFDRPVVSALIHQPRGRFSTDPIIRPALRIKAFFQHIPV